MTRAIPAPRLRAMTAGALMAAATVALAACTAPAPGPAGASTSPAPRSGAPAGSSAVVTPEPAGSGAGTSTASASAAAPSASVPGPSGLPEPLPTLRPVGSAVLSRSGTGNSPLDLSRLVGAHPSVSLAWVCVGPGDLRVESDGAVIAGGTCADTIAQVSSFGAVVPVARLASRRWLVRAGSSTRWRLVAAVH